MARFNNSGLDHVAIGVADIERSCEFYESVLGFERLHPEWEMPIVMGTAETGIAIFDKSVHLAAAPPEAEAPAARILHIAFRVDRAGFDAARSELAEAEFSDHGISHSLYIRDPDGHQIELTTYEV